MMWITRKSLNAVALCVVMLAFATDGRAQEIEVDAVLLTHFHSDHVVGLADLWLTGWVPAAGAQIEVVAIKQGVVPEDEGVSSSGLRCGP